LTVQSPHVIDFAKISQDPAEPVTSPDQPSERPRTPILTARQADVLRAVVDGYVAEATPVGCETIVALLPVHLSPASVRNTLAELSRLGLVDKPHPSAGRVPTQLGFRVYVDQLLAPSPLCAAERRDLAGSVREAPADAIARVASRLLSERTRQLGFVEPPRLDRIVLRHVSFVRVSTERVLVVLISSQGTAFQRLIEEPGRGGQAELDRMAASLNERLGGRTLREVRNLLVGEAAALRSQADWLLERALRTGSAVESIAGEVELVIATRLALLDQPEFHDPDRIRELFEAVETQERLVRVLERVIESGRVQVTFGGEMDEPALRECALVAAPYGREGRPLGALGVIGPHRMDYAHVIPLVDYLSRLLTGRLDA
jgi:heat-inducible transcriptional repressor